MVIKYIFLSRETFIQLLELCQRCSVMPFHSHGFLGCLCTTHNTCLTEQLHCGAVQFCRLPAFQENFSIQFKVALQRRVQLIKDFVEFYGLFTLPNNEIETDTDKMCTKPNGTLLGLILSAVRTLPHNSISVSVFVMESGSVNTPFRGWSIYCDVWSINSTVKRICNKKKTSRKH